MNRPKTFWDGMAKHGPEKSVIDPGDHLGFKNKYIRLLRDQTILKELSKIDRSALVLDFGCGSGLLTKTIFDNGYRVVGVDISHEMIKHAREQEIGGQDVFVQYDGNSLPFASNVFDACVIYGVLIYLVEDNSLLKTLGEIHRVLKPGGKLLAIEQTRRVDVSSPRQMKRQRRADEVTRLLCQSRFHIDFKRIIRRGHFPLIYAIRYGLVPGQLYSFIAKIEGGLGRIFKKTLFDYADTLFVARK